VDVFLQTLVEVLVPATLLDFRFVVELDLRHEQPREAARFIVFLRILALRSAAAAAGEVRRRNVLRRRPFFGSRRSGWWWGRRRRWSLCLDNRHLRGRHAAPSEILSGGNIEVGPLRGHHLA